MPDIAVSDCPHPAPITGVMAHEFGHYAGALGPEGKRRTVTFYGPVVGGLPISAWHCPECGLLRLDYPDGRTEERRLHPGPQPGLLAEPTPSDPQQRGFGMQARVSGLSLSNNLEQIYTAVPAAPRQISVRDFPDLNFFDWASVVLLAGSAIGLLVVAVMAIGGYNTADATGPAAWITAGLFLAALLMQLCRAVIPDWGRSSMTRIAEASVWRSGIRIYVPDLIAVIFLTLTCIGLFLAAVLAVYDLTTPGAEGGVVAGTVLSAVIAAAATLYSWIRNHGDTAPTG